MAKPPGDIAGRFIYVDSLFCRVHFKLPEKEARWRARREFRFFPVDAYLTEIDEWQELPNGQIAFSVKRLRQPKPAFR